MKVIYTEFSSKILTKGKVYEVVNNTLVGVNCYVVLDNIGQRRIQSRSSFITVEEWRDKQLKELGI